MDETDDTLAQRAANDVEAFATLYRRHLHGVYSYLLSRVENIQDAQDLTTQTFMAALSTISTYKPRGLFRAWLSGIARRKAADHFRKRYPEISLDDLEYFTDPAPSPEIIVDQHLQMQELAIILNKFNPDRAEALRLRIFGELKIQEIAEVMGKSEGAVKMLIARALEDLRNYTRETTL